MNLNNLNINIADSFSPTLAINISFYKAGLERPFARSWIKKVSQFLALQLRGNLLMAILVKDRLL
jgi:hypothetical protein